MSGENPSVTECSGSSVANSRCLYSIRSVLVLHSYGDPIAEVLGAWGWVYVRGQRDRQLQYALAGSLFFAGKFSLLWWYVGNDVTQITRADDPPPFPPPRLLRCGATSRAPGWTSGSRPHNDRTPDALFPTVPRTCFPANNGRWSRVQRIKNPLWSVETGSNKSWLQRNRSIHHIMTILVKLSLLRLTNTIK